MIKILKYKRILAVILLIITILSITQPIFAVSGSGTATWVGGPILFRNKNNRPFCKFKWNVNQKISKFRNWRANHSILFRTWSGF